MKRIEKFRLQAQMKHLASRRVYLRPRKLSVFCGKISDIPPSLQDSVLHVHGFLGEDSNS